MFQRIKQWFNPKPEVKSSVPSKPPAPLAPKKQYISDTQSVGRVLRHDRLCSDSGSDFLTRVIVSDLTNSAALGYFAGGSIAGALVGEMISNDNSHESNHSSVSQDNSSYDNSSYDSSNCDSSSSDNSW